MKLYRIILTILLFVLAAPSFAQTVDEIKSRIEDRNNTIKQLEEEIRKFQADIEALGKEADSLKKTLAELDLSKKKLEKNMDVTRAKIENTTQEINELSTQIEDKSERIGDSRRVISQSLYSIAQNDHTSLLETLLGAPSLAAAWNGAEQLTNLQGSVRNRIQELRTVRTSLETNKKLTEKKKAELLSLQNDLSNQRKVLAATVSEKNTILAATKNTESNYKKILAQKEAQKDAFEKELAELEEALQIAIDPSKLPSAGKGVLEWPLAKIRITQYFGNTPFASANPQVYNGKGHTGIDFAASIGTPVYASKGGEVIGMGNTDAIRGCYSYGKWIMIKHPNGLSTLYAHLSLQTVAVGQEVKTGQTIGYSGNTGYSTGPHLHFGVYATEGVRITKLSSSVNCRNAIIPIADPKAYLNPLSYL